MARVKANIKRHDVDHHASPVAMESEHFFEGFSLHPERREVRVNEEPVDLTTMEYELLSLLAAAPGQALSRDDILAKLKGTENELFSRSVDILVSRLRAKLRPANPIKTIHGAGYAFVAPRAGTST